ncbi:MAG: hypothetical protein OHK0039_38420 [Bacteroidia bacterium]
MISRRRIADLWAGCCLALFLLSGPGGRGQEVYYTRLQALRAADGLPGDQVRCLLEDRAGFLWIGTRSGLSRYDGRLFYTYSAHEGADRLAGDLVTDIVEDRSGIIWVASLDGGLTRIDPRQAPGQQTRRLAHIPGDAASLPVNRLRALFDFDDDYLLISAEQAPLVFMDKRTFVCRTWTAGTPVHPRYARPGGHFGMGWFHRMVPIDSSGVLMNYLHNRELWPIDTRTGLRLPGFSQSPMWGNVQSYTQACYDDTYLFAAGWQQGVARWERLDSTCLHILDIPDEVTALCWLDSATLLAGTRNKGLYLLPDRGDRWVPLHVLDAGGLVFDLPQVYELLRDRSGTVWVATAAGLYRMSDTRNFRQSGPLLPPDIDAHVFSIAEVQGERFLCTTQGLYRYLPEGPSFAPMSLAYAGSPLTVTTVAYCETLGWLLGSEQGLYCWDRVRGHVGALPVFRNSGGAALPNNFLQIRSIVSDTLDGRPCLLLGVLGYGVMVLDLRAGTYAMHIHSPDCADCLRNNLVSKLLRTSDGDYWVATARGLYHWPRAHLLSPRPVMRGYYQGEGQLPADDIADILPDGAGGLWVATRRGLVHVQGDTVRTYRSAWPRGNTIRQLLYLGPQRLLLFTEGGTMLFDGGRFVAIHSSDEPWADGCLAGPGHLLLAGSRHWRLLRIRDLLATPPPPWLYLSALHVGTTAVHPGGALQLSFRDYFRVQISALGLQGGDFYDLTYQWEGMDTVWQVVPTDGWVLVSRPAAGTQVLRARVSTPDGRWRQEEALLTVVIRPPFWKTGWFVAAVVLLLGLLFYAAYRYWLSQLLQQQHMRQRIAGDLHDEVGSALSSILIGSELAGKFMASDAAKSHMLMDKIQTIASQTLDNMSDIIWAIHPRHDGGGQTLAKMQQVLNDLLVQAGTDLTFEADPAIQGLALSMDGRKNLMLLFKEAIHNIVRHAGARAVTVSLRIEQKHLHLRIADDGRGFVPDQQNGHGLDNMQRRAEALRGRLVIDTAPGQGTQLHLAVPLGAIRGRRTLH